MIFSKISLLPGLMEIPGGNPNRSSLEGDFGIRRQILRAPSSERPFSSYLAARSDPARTTVKENDQRADSSQSPARSFDASRSSPLREAPADADETAAHNGRDTEPNELRRRPPTRAAEKQPSADEPTEASKRTTDSSARPEPRNRPDEGQSDAQAVDDSQAHKRDGVGGAQPEPAVDSTEADQPFSAEHAAEQQNVPLTESQLPLLELVENFESPLESGDNPRLSDPSGLAEAQTRNAEAKADSQDPSTKATASPDTRPDAAELLTALRASADDAEPGTAGERSRHTLAGPLRTPDHGEQAVPSLSPSLAETKVLHEEADVNAFTQVSFLARENDRFLQGSAAGATQAESAARAQTPIVEAGDSESSRDSDRGTSSQGREAAAEPARSVLNVGLPAPKAAVRELPHSVMATQLRQLDAVEGGPAVGGRGAQAESEALFSTANPQGEGGERQKAARQIPSFVTSPEASPRPEGRAEQAAASAADRPEPGNTGKPSSEISALQEAAGKQMYEESADPHGQPQRQRSVLSQPVRAGRGEPIVAAGRQGGEELSMAAANSSADRGGTAATAKPAGGAAAERVQSVERLIDQALLQRKADSHRLDLLMQDERVGRVSLRLTERAGLVDAMLRADSVRGRDMLVESLPSLLESLARRGLESSLAGNNEAKYGGGEPFEQHRGRSRQPRHSQQRPHRGEKQGQPVFRLETE